MRSGMEKNKYNFEDQMRRFKSILFAVIVSFFTTNCFDIIQYIKFNKDGSAKFSFRLTIYKSNELGSSKTPDTGEVGKMFSGTEENPIKVTSISNDFYTGVEAKGKIPKEAFPTEQKVVSEQSFLPIIDGDNQIVFVYYKATEEKKTSSESEEMAMAFLGSSKFRIFFEGEFVPKKGNLKSISNGKSFTVDPIPFGNGVLVEFPVVYAMSGGILTLSKATTINTTVADSILKQIAKNKEALNQAEEKKKQKEKKESPAKKTDEVSPQDEKSADY